MKCEMWRREQSMNDCKTKCIIESRGVGYLYTVRGLIITPNTSRKGVKKTCMCRC